MPSSSSVLCIFYGIDGPMQAVITGKDRSTRVGCKTARESAPPRDHQLLIYTTPWVVSFTAQGPPTPQRRPFIFRLTFLFLCTVLRIIGYVAYISTPLNSSETLAYISDWWWWKIKWHLYANGFSMRCKQNNNNNSWNNHSKCKAKLK